MQLGKENNYSKGTNISNLFTFSNVIFLTSSFFLFFILFFSSSVYAESELSWDVSFDSYPRVTPIIVDGVTYLPHQQPVTFSWLKGSSHQFQVGENVTKIDLNNQYRFEQWNDGYNIGNTRIITAAKDMDYIAILKSQYYLTIKSEYGTPEGEGWYDKGETVSISVDSFIEIEPGSVRRLFVNWDNGLTPQSNENRITLFSSTTISVSWKTQYYLDVTSDLELLQAIGSGWYDEGSNADISINSEYVIKDGKHKFDFDQWESFGINQPIIEQNEDSTTIIKMNNHYNITATWNEVWNLKITSDPPNLLSNEGNEWHLSGSRIQVLKAPEKNSDYKFLGWLVDNKSVSNNPFVLEMNQSHVIEAKYAKYYSVIFDVFPQVSSLIIDNQIYLPNSFPLTFDWIEGSEHTFELPSTKVAVSSGLRYLFTEWNDLETTESRQIIIDKDVTYTALLETQYYLTIISQYGSPIGEGWYDSGTTAFFSIEPIADQITNKFRHLFLGWDQGHVRSNSNNSIDITGPTFVTAQWKPQYYLSVLSSVEDIIVKGGGWYDVGSSAKIITVSEYEPDRNRHKYTFREWISNDQIIAIGNPEEAVTTVLMDDAYEIEAEWDEWFYLNIDSIYGNPTGKGYHLNGSLAIIEVNSPFDLLAYDSRMVFTEWSGQLGLNDARVSVIMDASKTLKAEWKKQYYMKIISHIPNFQGAGWYNENDVITVSVSESINAGIGRQTVFENWSGDIQSEEIQVKIEMDSSHTVYANWNTDSSILNIMFTLLLGTVLVTLLFVGYNFSKSMNDGTNKILLKLKNRLKLGRQ